MGLMTPEEFEHLKNCQTEDDWNALARKQQAVRDIVRDGVEKAFRAMTSQRFRADFRDLIPIQPLSTPVGAVFYLDYRYSAKEEVAPFIDF